MKLLFSRLNQFADQAGENLKVFLRNNVWLFLFAIAVAFFAFGYELFNFSETIDEEIDAYRTAWEKKEYLLNGRWGAWLLNLFFIPQSVLPYYPTMLALSGLAVSVAVFLSFQQVGRPAKIIFTVLFLTNPIHAGYLAFNTLNIYFGMGAVFVALSFILLQKALTKKRHRLTLLMLSIFSLTAAISIYQALLTGFIVYLAFYLFNMINTSRNGLLRNVITFTLWGGVIIISAFLFYKVSDSIVRNIFLEPLQEQKLYLDNFIHWGKKPLREVLLNLSRIISDFLLGRGYLKSQSGMTQVFLLPMIIYTFFVIFTRRNILHRKLLLSGALLLLLLSGFAMIIINGNAMPSRAMMALPLMMALIWLISYTQSGAYLRKAIIVIALLIAINNVFINTRLFYTAKTVWDADRDLANRLTERILGSNPPITNGKIKVHLAGNVAYKANELFIREGIFGLSKFEINEISPSRTEKIFLQSGITYFRFIKPGSDEINSEILHQMPCWPINGSVTIVGDIIYVKLSDDSNQ